MGQLSDRAKGESAGVGPTGAVSRTVLRESQLQDKEIRAIQQQQVSILLRKAGWKVTPKR